MRRRNAPGGAAGGRKPPKVALRVHSGHHGGMMTDSASTARCASLAGMVIAFACPVLAACQSHANGPPPGNIVVNAAAPSVAIDRDQLGTNLAIWYDVTTPTLPGEVAQLGAHILRWPGGSGADSYHWQHQTQCAKSGDKYQSGSAW